MHRKLKSFLSDDTAFFAVLLVVVAGVSFLLGQYSVSAPTIQPAQQGVVVTQPVVEVVPEAEKRSFSASGTQVVASKSGTKYHLVDCPGAKQMKDANKIFFASIEQAKAAGYSPAANCKGLK